MPPKTSEGLLKDIGWKGVLFALAVMLPGAMIYGSQSAQLSSHGASIQKLEQSVEKMDSKLTDIYRMLIEMKKDR